MSSYEKAKPLTKVATYGGYDYYTGVDEDFNTIYNIVPAGSPAPKGGYWHKNWILAVKKAVDMFEAT